MHQNPSDEERRRILTKARNVAVVGLSQKAERTSHSIARALQAAGYRIFPVNPNLVGPVFGEKPYASLGEIGEPIDVVDVFRRGEDVMPIAREVAAVGARTLWMQKGVVNQEAAEYAREHGLGVVMDRCMRADYKLLIEHQAPAASPEEV